MSKAKVMYMDKHGETCYDAEYWQNIANDGDPVTVEECVKMLGSDYMWCLENGELIERGDGGCGKNCPTYKPCNGKSGRCRNLTNCYEANGKMVTFYPKP